MSNVSEFFAKVPESVNTDKIQGMNATFLFDISGDNGGQFAVAIADGAATVTEGAVDNPSITLSLTDENFVDLVTGKLNGQTAFLTGKLKIKGDMGLAMKLGSIFSMG